MGLVGCFRDGCGGLFISYNSKSFNVDIMKRTKSTLSLRNLAMSIKQSIQLEADRTAKKEFAPLATTKSLAALLPKERNSQSLRQENGVNR